MYLFFHDYYLLVFSINLVLDYRWTIIYKCTHFWVENVPQMIYSEGSKHQFYQHIMLKIEQKLKANREKRQILGS